jgi:hypothetical protein
MTLYRTYGLLSTGHTLLSRRALQPEEFQRFTAFASLDRPKSRLSTETKWLAAMLLIVGVLAVMLLALGSLNS